MGAPKTMLASYPSGGIGYIPHQDNVFRNQFRNRTNPRELTAILYVNPLDWDPERDGGQLKIYPRTETIPDIGQIDESTWPGITTVSPVGGRLVIFFSMLWHEVLPAHRERRALTQWIYRPCKELREGERDSFLGTNSFEAEQKHRPD